MKTCKDILKINRCYGKFAEKDGTHAFVIFKNGTYGIRKKYYSKKANVEYIVQNNKYYQISYSDASNTYIFKVLEDREVGRLVESKEAKKATKIKEEPKESNHDEADVKHSTHELIKTCVKSNIPVYLCGEAGTGKNYTLQKVAEELGIDFYFTNSVQQEYKLTGFIDAGGIYHETEFYKAFKNGGLFFLDEMDASIPEVLVLLNAAIANRYFEFPTGRLEANKFFRVVSAGNTLGSGADELYTGRMVIDQATLDRFSVIKFGYERRIELSIAKGNKELVDFINDIRRVAKKNAIRATFSYRAIEMVTKLEKRGVELETVLQIAVFKGLDKEEITIFDDVLDDNRYSKAMQKLIAS